MNRYGAFMTVGELKDCSSRDLSEHLTAFVQELDLKAGTSQVKSWLDCIEYLKASFEGIDFYDSFYLAFEYCIPFSGYRRPDVVLFSEEKIVVLEFKRKENFASLDEQQLRGYLNELRNYHEENWKMNVDVEGCLVVTRADQNEIEVKDGLYIIQGHALRGYLDEKSLTALDKGNVESWLMSDYKPLMNILESTKEMFQKGNIPEVRNILEKDIQSTLDTLHRLSEENKDEKRIVFLTGAPGSGKTLALMHTLYHLNQHRFNSLFLSGNGPLVSALGYMLSKDKNKMDGRSFIKAIKEYKGEYFDKWRNEVKNSSKTYSTICFDEAQRAWDINHMRRYKFQLSEPELLLQVQDQAYKTNHYTNLICSIGEGQSIYYGEESGFEIWSEILKREEYQDWKVYVSPKLAHYFKDLEHTTVLEELHMGESIRGNFADTSKFIEALMEVDPEACAKEVKKLRKQGFDIKVSRDFQSIKDYLHEYEQDTGDRFYGLVCSSNASRTILEKELGEKTRVLTQNDEKYVGEWYTEDCSQLDALAPEFVCQGLELNIPVVFFGGDYIIYNGEWIVYPPAMRGKRYQDPGETIRNIYRVLLSRGRKGTLLYIPPFNGLNETFELIKDIGIEELEGRGANG